MITSEMRGDPIGEHAPGVSWRWDLIRWGRGGARFLLTSMLSLLQRLTALLQLGSLTRFPCPHATPSDARCRPAYNRQACGQQHPTVRFLIVDRDDDIALEQSY